MVLAIGFLPNFPNLLAAFREFICRGDNLYSWSRSCLVEDAAGRQCFQEVLNRLVVSYRRLVETTGKTDVDTPLLREKLEYLFGHIFFLVKQSRLLDTKGVHLVFPKDILALVKEYEETCVKQWLF